MDVTDPAKIERIEEVVALVLARTPVAAQPQLEAFAREYFRQVDPDDVVERTAADLMGATAVALAARRAPRARPCEGARAVPAQRRRAWLELAPHGDRDRQ